MLLLASPACLAEHPPYQHGISLLHELKYARDFQHFDFADPAAPRGGSLNLATTQPIRNLSGAWGTMVPSAAGVERTQDRLFVRSADEHSAMYGLLADGVVLSEDGTRLYIRLHADARWHDGVPVTTRDIQYSWEVLSRTSLATSIYMGEWVAELEIVNDREWVIHHHDAFSQSNLMTLTNFPVRAAHYYTEGDIDPGAPTMAPPLTSGPYTVVDVDRNHVVYKRVADYWGRNLPVNRGRHNFDTVRYDVYRDSTVAREAFRKGLFDIHLEADTRYWHASDDLPALVDGRMRKETRRVTRLIGLDRAIAFNLEKPLFRDRRVREALTLAFDFEWQNRVFRNGSQQRALSYFAGSLFAATGLPTPGELELLEPFRDQLPARLFTQPFDLPASDGWGEHREALERARRLLAEAGWHIEDGVLRNAAGEGFEFEVATQNGWARRLLLPYIESLSWLGIKARLRLLENVQAVKYKRQRRFDLYFRGHDLANPPMGQLGNYFSTASAVRQMGGNLGSIRSPVVDALIERAQNAPDLATATSACRALDRVLLWGFYHVPLNMPEEERYLFWDRFGRPDQSSATYEFLMGGTVRLIDSWWIRDRVGRGSVAASTGGGGS